LYRQLVGHFIDWTLAVNSNYKKLLKTARRIWCTDLHIFFTLFDVYTSFTWIRESRRYFTPKPYVKTSN